MATIASAETICNDAGIATRVADSDFAKLFFWQSALDRASKILDIPKDKITGKGGDKLIYEARWALWKVMHENGASYPQIARRFNRNHATIFQGVRHANNLMSNSYFAAFVEAIRG